MPANTTERASRRLRLERYRRQVQNIILARQDAHTGLLPASTAITVHGDYTHAWVRDNVYSILAVWGLALAYRRQDREDGTTHAAELSDAVARLMRGLLAAMMKQSHKVERFKHTQDPLDALHAKYDTKTGEPVVGDSEWGHLQLDATAIFVLLLAQMSASGVSIVQTPAEVAFVQNLVYYLARAYRTPDYGIWERGHKRNEGVAEVNASSVGMAKAALEAISGFVFLPGQAPAVHVLADDIAQARNTLEGLLPRESESKETDAALLAVIGFPAFAVEDAALEARTRADIVGKLQGRYGCKRFLRDGHQTVLEDHSRMHYEPGELAQFEHIESEWPLFFTYLLLDAALGGREQEAADYRTRLDALLQERDGEWLLPELYYVPADAVDAERLRPHSQPRLPNANVPLVWAQSLYVLGVLLQEGYLTPADLNPLARQRRTDPPREVQVQVALLAEDELVQMRLAAQGVAAQTLQQVQPIDVRYAADLQAALAGLGRDDEQGLSGRPPYALGTLATSQAFTIGGTSAVFLPSFFNRRGFYLSLDNRLLVDDIAAELAQLRRHWRQPGEPLLALLLTEPMLDAAGADLLLQHLRELQQGTVPGVRLGRLKALLPVVATQTIDWATRLPSGAAATANGDDVQAVLTWEEGATRVLTTDRAAALERESDPLSLLRQLSGSRNPYEQVEILGLLWQQQGAAFDSGLGGSVSQLLEAVYARACRGRRWGVMRRAAGWLDVHDESLEEAVAQIVVHRKRVAVGRAYSAEAVIAQALGNAEIVARLREDGGDDPRGRVLIEEVVLLLGMLVRAEPELFQGTLTLRAWHLIQLITGWLAREHGVSPAEAFDHLLDLSPHAILGRLRETIAREQEMARNLLRLQSLHHTGGADGMVWISFAADDDPAPSAQAEQAGQGQGGWFAWREMTGAITRAPEDFHVRVWELLQHCTGLVIGDQLDARNRLDSTLARADMTPAERSFALQVEDLLNKIQAPEYRQLTLEALLTVSDLFRANADLHIDGVLVLDVLIGTAVKLNWQHTHADAGSTASAASNDYNEHLAHAWQDFYAAAPHQVANAIVAAMARLLQTPAQDVG